MAKKSRMLLRLDLTFEYLRNEGIDHSETKVKNILKSQRKHFKKFLPIKVVEKGQEIKCQFDPPFLLTFVQCICVHDACRIIKTRTAHDGSMQVPVNMITNEWSIDQKGEPLPSKQEKDVKKDV